MVKVYFITIIYAWVLLSYEANGSNSSRFRRKRSKFQCNEVVAEISPNDVVAYFHSFVNDLRMHRKPLRDLNVPQNLRYGVRAKTVCASCQSMLQSLDDSNIDKDEFEKYCGKEVYGHDIEHSGLVLIPLVLDDNGTVVEKPGTHMGFVHNRGTTFNRFSVPSSLRPWFGNGKFANDKRNVFIGFLATASAGTVSILPDYMGYGGSHAWRAYMIRNAYVTATLPLWMKVSYDLKKETNCKSALANAAFLAGYSEGGYASISIAEGLQSVLNIRIEKVMVGGTPFRLLSAMMKAIKMTDLGISDYYRVGLLFGISYSSTYPSVANYETGQDLLDPKYTNTSNPELNFFHWVLDLDLKPNEIDARLNRIAQSVEGSLMEEIWNTEFENFLQDALANNVTNPCSPLYSGYKVGINDKLCQALNENDLIETIHSVEYPVESCFSRDDELVPYDSNIPDIERNPEYLTINEVQGTHFTSSHACHFNVMKYVVSDAFRSLTTEQNHDMDGCKSDSPSSNPSQVSSLIPTTSPSSIPTINKTSNPSQVESSMPTNTHSNIPTNGVRECPVQDLTSTTLYLQSHHKKKSFCWQVEFSMGGRLKRTRKYGECNESDFTNIRHFYSEFDRFEGNILHFKKRGTKRWSGHIAIFETPHVSTPELQNIRHNKLQRTFSAQAFVPNCA